jgi:hypothetical protein
MWCMLVARVLTYCWWQIQSCQRQISKTLPVTWDCAFDFVDHQTCPLQ